MADAIILGLYLDSHISHLHSWVLTGARQVKHRTRGGQNDRGPPGAVGPRLSSAPGHYQKHRWPLFHLANAYVTPCASSLSVLGLCFSLFLTSLTCPCASCHVISSDCAQRLSPFLPLTLNLLVARDLYTDLPSWVGCCGPGPPIWEFGPPRNDYYFHTSWDLATLPATLWLQSRC